MDIGELLHWVLSNIAWDSTKWVFRCMAGAGVLVVLVGLVQRVKDGSLDWWILGSIFISSSVLLYLTSEKFQPRELLFESRSLEDIRNDPPPGYWSGPIGPFVAVRFVHLFSRLPKPCKIKITSTQENESLVKTLTWLLKSGGVPSDVAPHGSPICEIEDSQMPLPNIDEPDPVRQTTQPGIVIHVNAEYESGEPISRFFYTNGFKVSTSYRLPAKSSPDLIWLDIGPGSPWRDRR